MVATIIKSALLGLILGAALAYAAESGPSAGIGDFIRDGGSTPVQLNSQLPHGSKATR